jgi:hypothetical protein
MIVIRVVVIRVVVIGMVVIGMVVIGMVVIGMVVASLIIVPLAFVGMVVIFGGVIGRAVAIVVMVGMVMILCRMVRLAVAVMSVVGFRRVIMVRRFLSWMIFRGMVGHAVAVVIMRHARFRRGAVHHLAHLQHGLGPVRLLFQHEGLAMLGDHCRVEPRFAAATDAQ